MARVQRVCHLNKAARHHCLLLQQSEKVTDLFDLPHQPHGVHSTLAQQLFRPQVHVVNKDASGSHSNRLRHRLGQARGGIGEQVLVVVAVVVVMAKG
jgi:hypothetical protein